MSATLPLEQFLIWEQRTPHEIFLRQPVNGVWNTWSWAQAGQECRKMAQRLTDRGLGANDHIAILSKNCAHWIMADIAIMMIGAISVPIYPTLTDHAIQPILEHSESKAIFIGKLDDFESQRKGVPDNILQIGFDYYGMQGSETWGQSIATSAPLHTLHTWQPDDIITIIYTSGTTGRPKGVMHKAVTFEKVLIGVGGTLNLPKKAHLFSYLPLSHIAERLAIEMNAIYYGSTISFTESLETFSKNLADVQPHVFFAVPRIWSKLREGILKKMPQEKLSKLLRIPLVGLIVKKSIRKKLGLSRAKNIYSAAAPITVELIDWFQTLGITIYQGYGMSEDCAYGHFCREGHNKPGSVGKPVDGLSVKLTAEGEICVKSPGNLVGYYKEPELTAEIFDEEGYLKTGDKGEYDSDGYLWITGRVKDQFKTDKGKYISPAPIELDLQADECIEQVCVVGNGIPQPIALITLSLLAKKMSKEAIDASIANTVVRVNATLEKHEQIAKAIILQGDWSVENGLMTPTLKVKRNEVEKIYLKMYPVWYGYDEFVIWI